MLDINIHLVLNQKNLWYQPLLVPNWFLNCPSTCFQFKYFFQYRIISWKIIQQYTGILLFSCFQTVHSTQVEIESVINWLFESCWSTFNMFIWSFAISGIQLCVKVFDSLFSNYQVPASSTDNGNPGVISGIGSTIFTRFVKISSLRARNAKHQYISVPPVPGRRQKLKYCQSRAFLFSQGRETAESDLRLLSWSLKKDLENCGGLVQSSRCSRMTTAGLARLIRELISDSLFFSFDASFHYLSKY